MRRRPSSHQRSQLFPENLPDTGFFGSDGRKRTSRGHLYFASREPQNAMRACASTAALRLSATKAHTSAPISASRIPTTAASATAGCAQSTSSISRGYTLSPPG